MKFKFKFEKVSINQTFHTGQRHQCGAPDLMPLWTILDSTPEGRGSDWYPKLG